MLLALSRLDSPVGRIYFAADDSSLRALEFYDSEEQLRLKLERTLPGARFASGGAGPSFVLDALGAYFAGDVTALESVSAEGAGTPFQRKVWAALRTIPPGQTISYRTLAARVGSPGSFRAVGAANGQNPISLVVPCHRVIASDGTLCGYGGGLWRKEWLLRHEGALLA
jgi:methylated-DNA-[protein]-cysteine S-methyltransferase